MSDQDSVRPNDVFLPPPGRTYSEALDNIRAAVQRESAQIAPRLDEHGRRNWQEGSVPPNLMLSEIVVVTMWSDLDTGGHMIEVDTDERLRSHTVGLLTAALDYKRGIGR